jgi:Cu(I)/Ag(I) efflux system periplasmic protein CusF
MKCLAIASIVAAVLAVPALAEEAHHNKQSPGAQGATQSSGMTEGEVRKVDRNAKKITLKHDRIENLDMPAHSMVFQVRDPAMLDQVKAGDKVKFQAEKIGGAFTITKIESAN